MKSLLDEKMKILRDFWEKSRFGWGLKKTPKGFKAKNRRASSKKQLKEPNRINNTKSQTNWIMCYKTHRFSIMLLKSSNTAGCPRLASRLRNYVRFRASQAETLKRPRAKNAEEKQGRYYNVWNVLGRSTILKVLRWVLSLARSQPFGKVKG